MGLGPSKGELLVQEPYRMVHSCGTAARRKDLVAYLHLWNDHKCKGVYFFGYLYRRNICEGSISVYIGVGDKFLCKYTCIL